MIRLRTFCFISGLVLVAAQTGCGQTAGGAPFVAESARVAVETLAKQLEDNFVYPDIGASYARMLRSQLRTGAYSRFESAAEFATAVTADLQNVNREGHLRVVPPREMLATSPYARVPDAGKGLVRAGWVAPGVAYMSVHGFQGSLQEYNEQMDDLRAVLDSLSTSKSLIVDARYYIGGALEETDVMASYFFAEPTTLLEFDTRLAVEERGFGVLQDNERLVRVEGPEGIVRRRQIVIPVEHGKSLGNSAIYVLTSKHTASGGEGFALAMKRTKRATLIGATTAGAGHFGRNVPLGGGYQAFIPIGRPFDPTTGKGWELTGIEPDVRTDAEQALDEALRRAGVDVADGRKAVDRLPKRSARLER